MKLWGGRFTRETNQLVHNSNESLPFGQKFYHQDIRGSVARVKMLTKQGILTEQNKDDIVRGLGSILEDLDSDKSTISSDSGCENIYFFVKGTSTERIGEAGRRLHTGRSRNNQVALDVKLYTRDEIDAIEALVKELLEGLPAVMEKNTGTFTPGFTHLQKTQPITLIHRMGACFEMFSRDHSRLKDIRRRVNYCPLGSGALAGTAYPLDRKYTAELLGFDGLALNSMDSVADRDCPIEFLSALPTISIHLSRFCEGTMIWNTNEYRFVEIDDSYSTGSFVMPQRKSPDTTEPIRGKSGRVYGTLVSMLTTMKGTPLVYSKSMQEDKELTFNTIDTVKGCLALFAGMISSMSFRKEIVEASAKNSLTDVTDAADYLVNKGVPFRDAHGIAGRLILVCISKGAALDDLSLKEYKAISPVFEEDIHEAISIKACMEKRFIIGAPEQRAMKKVVGIYRRQLRMDDT